MRQDQCDAALVDALYDRYVTQAGYQPPSSAAELQTIIIESGISIEFRGDSPPEFLGIQIKGTIFINGRLRPGKTMRVLAHEWFHALRWLGAVESIAFRLYDGLDPETGSSREEHLARLFERRFTD